MPRPDENIVLKYCELLDEFIRIRRTPEEDLGSLVTGSRVSNRAAYHQLVVDRCVVEFATQVKPLFERHDRVYQPEALVELLYQICIEVNPHYEIHSVTLPVDGNTESRAEDVTVEGRPLEEMQEHVADLEEALARRVVGQQAAVRAVARAVQKASVGLKDPSKPVGVFLLVGPTGTGKTQLAKSLTRHLFGNLAPLVRIDCSEYALPHEYAKLIGAPPGYIGHNEGGQLTEAVKKLKAGVVLFDEVEKAHEKVHNLLLQLMDEGFLTDSKGERVSFQHCLVLMTSNIGVEDVQRIRQRVGFDSRRGPASDGAVAFTMAEAVKKAFRPEFVNRIDDVIRFRSLDRTDCERIARLQLEEMAGYLERTGVALRFRPSLCAHLARVGWSPEYGARELRRHIRDTVEAPLTERLMKGDFRAGDSVTLGVRGTGRLVMTRGRRRTGTRRGSPSTEAA